MKSLRLENEQNVLDEAIRKKIIHEINSPENKNRKMSAKRRYDIYKDRTKEYVIKALEQEGLLPDTVNQMANRAANISICRKVVEKKSKTYAGGVTRIVTTKNDTAKADDDATSNLQKVLKLLNWHAKMKKADRFRELQKNSMIQIVPEALEPNNKATPYRLLMKVLQPWQYDVVERFVEREKPMVVILSDFTDQPIGQHMLAATQDEAGYRRPELQEGQARVSTNIDANYRNANDDIIADRADDAGHGGPKYFIWWTDNYHFTTDENGKILGDLSDGTDNPIGCLPFRNNAEDQDGQFWAEGGEDLIDGAILINKLITDMNYITYHQGFGQPVITGKNIKKNVSGGPNRAIILSYDEGEPKPEFQIVSSPPQTDGWLRIVEQHTALLLTTNNLSPGNVSITLDSSSYASGVAMLIEKSETTEDVSDKQTDYQDIERDLIRILTKWLVLYGKNLSDDYKEIKPIPEDIEVSIKFNDLKPAVTEKEHVETLKARKDLGLNEIWELIQMDRQDMSLEECKAKAEAIHKAAIGIIKAGEAGEASEEEEGDGSEGESEPQAQGGEGEQVAGDAQANAVTDPKIALNGAQVASLLEIITMVATKQIPRETGVNMIQTSFALDLPTAEVIMGSVGKTFFADAPASAAPVPTPTPKKKGDKGGTVPPFDKPKGDDDEEDTEEEEPEGNT